MAKPEHDNMLFDDIVLFQILPRLPARSIGRFMSVCKQWQSFLTTPTFTKMHLNHVNNQNHPKIIAIPAKRPCNYFCTMDCETPEVGLSANRPLPFEMGRNMMSILSYLNGLVCVGIMPHSRICTNIILWNPLTGDYKSLAKYNYQANCYSGDARVCGLYYSICDDDYKMLSITESSYAYIYSWKSNLWRKAKASVDFLPESVHHGCLLNEKLYFIAKKDTHGRSRELIMRFDTKTETFTEIATPSSSKLYDMMVVGGCIYLCVLPEIDSDFNFNFWKMDGDEEWAKVTRYCMSPFMYQPCHLMKNGNWLLLARRDVVVYKLDRKEEEEEAKGACKHAIDNTMRLLQHGKFVETIESLKW